MLKTCWEYPVDFEGVQLLSQSISLSLRLTKTRPLLARRNLARVQPGLKTCQAFKGLIYHFHKSLWQPEWLMKCPTFAIPTGYYSNGQKGVFMRRKEKPRKDTKGKAQCAGYFLQ